MKWVTKEYEVGTATNKETSKDRWTEMSVDLSQWSPWLEEVVGKVVCKMCKSQEFLE